MHLDITDFDNYQQICVCNMIARCIHCISSIVGVCGYT